MAHGLLRISRHSRDYAPRRCTVRRRPLYRSGSFPGFEGAGDPPGSRSALVRLASSEAEARSSGRIRPAPPYRERNRAAHRGAGRPKHQAQAAGAKSSRPALGRRAAASTHGQGSPAPVEIRRPRSRGQNCRNPESPKGRWPGRRSAHPAGFDCLAVQHPRQRRAAQPGCPRLRDRARAE